MKKYWTKPTYILHTNSGKDINIDVTTSVSSGLPPNKVVIEQLIPFFKRKKVETVLDFGAGALRFSIPLLDAGFQVCAVEYEECFSTPIAKEALAQVKKHPNFSALIWPKQFIRDKRRFDAALLIYVLQIMPIQEERNAVIKYIWKKLEKDSYIFYASRYGQITEEDQKRRVNDGYYRWPNRKAHSFYREFTTEETHAMFEKRKFKYIRYLSERGTDQMFVYAKGKNTWI